MRANRIVVAAFVLVLSLAGGPALGDHGGIHPTFREESVYFHCTGPTKVYHANWLVAVPKEAAYTGWDTQPPAQSAAQGGGCGGVEWGGFTNAVYDVAFQGTFTGNLRDLTFRIHHLLLGNARPEATETLRLNAWIEGVPIFPEGTLSSHGRTVTVTPVRSETGASELFEFSITNIGYAHEITDENGEVVDVETGGVALEDGDGTEEHTLRVFLGVHGDSIGARPHKFGAWVWDATEVPSGITFNPEALAPAQMAADLPEFD